jgi:hypothetical protein
LKSGLTVLIATRGRPQQFLRAVESALATSATAKVLAYVDLDDPHVKDYAALSVERLTINFGERVGSAKALKVLMGLCKTEWFMLGADDIVFDTPHWDQNLISLIPEDKVAIAFGEDKHERQCNHFVFHRRLYELTGLWPDVFWHFGPDGYLGRVIEAVSPGRRKYSSQVVIRHLQAKAGKSPVDMTYVEERNRGHPRDEMLKAMESFDRDVSILKAEVERCSTSTV